MKRIFTTTFFLVLFASVSSLAGQKSWLTLNGSEPQKCIPVIHASSLALSEIEINLPGFFADEIQTPQGNAFSISFPGSAKMLEAGMPDLPQLTFSLAIPGNAEMKAEVISADYSDYSFPVAPSKGNLIRTIDPSSVPYTYGQPYSVDAFYPKDLTMMRDPYILRDFRGQTVVVRPFAYNPVTKILRVYYSIRIKVSATGQTNFINVLNNSNSSNTVDATFASIYKNHFLNSSVLNYTPLYEHGKMLIISDPSLMATMQPFVDWKNKMGQRTEIVDVSTIGTNANDIKTYIDNYYNTNGLTFVLLVGDGPQIEPFPSAHGDSDPSYGFILGNDTYAEVLVGRFSANNATELLTQVQRSLDYEIHPDISGQWYHKAVCIGSDQGPGDDNEYDYEHERNIRTDFMNYFYTDVDELYDGTQGQMDASGDPNAQDLINALNDGRGVVTYTGHGSSASLGTTGFSTNDVSSLDNSNQLPFIWSVACVNGDFRTGTCLAEALLRATSITGESQGAIATLMSTINQSWDPPMDGQDEMVDLLIESYPGNIKHTFGGISANGCMHMNDQYGSAGDPMTATWTLFGDPSLTVRTNTPAALTVTHSFFIDVNQSSFPVACSKDGALVCLSHNNQIITTAWTLLGSSILLPSGLHVGDTLDLVVTAYNAIPYLGKVVVTASTTGIHSITSDLFSVFPNPSNGILRLNLPENGSDISIQVIDAIGKTVLIQNSKQNKFDISSLASGVYSVVVYNKDNVLGSDKIIKK
jgi:hypothetical protein